ncbi:asparagine synthase (glutamine-hydrolyzing) [Aliarcobacter butzleri]|uniref:asparagine synthase (glutamine-hydrolyzing) n=1 Tax=Aliarcobacter butzleri TaxID=28197 RepID=UPI001EDBEC76|nr:asparagine synthase (glutamine-hydrolyzing) [Aliarcobacter butzleri]MCG3692886.1 asparagine synthase (glutamine-hydrolyzing) [Aliarcobacter butzleri]
MCGIAGIWSKNNREIQERYVDAILEKQYHRGPDNSSKFTIDDIVLGHNRLAIIDLNENANQPFVSNCGRYIVVFNGEIYNYLELKGELNYKFKTHSDTEVLLASYIKYGEKCIERFNGMFSFALYDKQEKILFCARDRIGKKPFLYSEHVTGFYFASELTALFNIGIFDDALDEIGVSYSYLRNYLHVPEPYTKYKSVRRLEPAHAIIVKDKKIVKKWCYWIPSFEYDSTITKEDVYNIVDDAVRIRERADVEIATLLSGGVDSSIITGLMVKHGLKPKAYTLKADDEELARAKRVAKLFDIPIKVFDYNKDLQKELYEKMISIYGEEIRLLPLTHSARLYEQISKENIKVVMSGIGADEIFYGYDGMIKQLLFSDIVKIVELLPNSFLKTFEKIFSFRADMKLMFELAQVENCKRKGYLYSKEGKEKGLNNFNYSTLIDFWAEKIKTKNYIDSSNWIGLMSENAHSITISTDLPAMMYSIEARAPFLDYRVIEMAFKIDAHRKITKKNGYEINKLILKQAFEVLLPKNILYAKKKGFGYGIQTGTNEEKEFFK